MLTTVVKTVLLKLLVVALFVSNAFVESVTVASEFCVFCGQDQNLDSPYIVPPNVWDTLSLPSTEIIHVGWLNYDEVSQKRRDDWYLREYYKGNGTGLDEVVLVLTTNDTLTYCDLMVTDFNQSTHYQIMLGFDSITQFQIVSYPACSGCRVNGAILPNNAGILLLVNSPTGGFSVAAMTYDPFNTTGKPVIVYQNIDARSTTPFRDYTAGRIDSGAVQTYYYGREVGYPNVIPPMYDTAGSVVLFGGYNIWGIPYNDVWAFHLATEQWEVLHNGTVGAPSARYAFRVTTIDDTNKMVLYGGGTDSNLSIVLSDIWIFNFALKQWQQVVPAPGSSDFSPLLYPILFSTTSNSILAHAGSTRQGLYLNPSNTLWEVDLSSALSTNLNVNLSNSWIYHCDNRDENLRRLLHTGTTIYNNFYFVYGGLVGDSSYVKYPLFYDYDLPRLLEYCTDLDTCSPQRVCNNVMNPLPTCPSSSSSSDYFPCIDGNCYKTISTCTSKVAPCTGPFSFQCANGQCVKSPSACAPIPRCPVGLQRCYDGSCSTNCTVEPYECTPFCVPNSTITVCLDDCCNSNCPSSYPVGSSNWTRSCCYSSTAHKCCPFNTTCCTSYPTTCTAPVEAQKCFRGCQKDPNTPCEPYDGCPGNYTIINSLIRVYSSVFFPAPLFQCPSGKCASSLTDCMDSATGLYVCVNGSTASSILDCVPSPILWKSYTGNSWPIQGTIHVISLSFVDVTLTVNTNDYQTPDFSIDVVPESDISSSVHSSWIQKPYLFTTYSTSYYDNIFSPVIRVFFGDCVGCTYTSTLRFEINLPSSYVTKYACLAKLVGKQWTCLASQLGSVVNGKKVGGLVGFSELTTVRQMSYGTFALVRASWPAPSASQILDYLFTAMFDLSSFIDPLYSKLPVTLDSQKKKLCYTVSSSSVTNTSMVYEKTAAWLLSEYNFPQNQLKITLLNITNTSYVLCFNLDDVPFPEIPSPSPPPPSTPSPVPQPQPLPIAEVKGPTSSDSVSMFVGIGVGVGIVAICAFVGIGFWIKNLIKKHSAPPRLPPPNSRMPPSQATRSRPQPPRAPVSSSIAGPDTVTSNTPDMNLTKPPLEVPLLDRQSSPPEAGGLASDPDGEGFLLKDVQPINNEDQNGYQTNDGQSQPPPAPPTDNDNNNNDTTINNDITQSPPAPDPAPDPAPANGGWMLDPELLNNNDDPYVN